MIRYLRQEEKKRSRRLWEAVFTEDSQGFVDYYYTEKIRRNKILAAEEDGEVIAMLHMNPYDVAVKDRVWRTNYIAGVATDARWRHRGYMRRLLLKGLSDMYMEKMAFCYLVPADPAIYQPFEFTYIFDRPAMAFNEKGMRRLGARACMEAGKDCRDAALFAGKLLEKDYEVYTMRDEEYYKGLCREVRSCDGDLILLKTKDDRERLAGISAYYGDGDTQPREFICMPEYCSEAGPGMPAVMGRIVNLEEFVRVIRLREESPVSQMELMIEVEDGEIAQNNGVFRWKLDREGSSLMRMGGKAGIRPQLSMGIGEMTAWLFGYKKPSAPEAKQAVADKIRPLRGVYFDEIV